MAERYGQIVQFKDKINSELIEIAPCLTCGALVFNSGLHDLFHEDIRDQSRRLDAMEERLNGS